MLFDKLLEPANESQIQAIKAELGENPERFQNNLKHLEQWMHCQPHLPKNYGENTLATYLRGCKNDMEKAKRKLEMFFVCKTKFPEILSVKEISNHEIAVLKTMTFGYMPKLTEKGYRLGIVKINDYDPTLFELTTTLRCAWMAGQVRICNEQMIGGDIYIFDSEYVTPMHVLKLINLKTKMSAIIHQQAFFAQIKALYVVNSSPVIEKLMNFFKMIITPKLRERLVVDSGISCLKDFPKECLPKEYGGTELSLKEVMDKQLQYRTDNHEWFENWEKVKLTGPLPKHIEHKLDFEDLQGIQGSFRKLDVD